MNKETQEKLNQLQMLWHMRFSEKLNEVLTYQQSLQYWEDKADSVSRNTKSAVKAYARNHALKMKEERRQELNRLTEEFQEWVKGNPYPELKTLNAFGHEIKMLVNVHTEPQAEELKQIQDRSKG